MTEHAGRRANRLVNETSPYLLQHAYNPVDWYPWGPESLQRAKSEQRPIFLSIGYSACHWCHVMERESFEDAEIAALMNERFVNIKVDREERPDLDQIYMNAVVALSGHGGWPMSVFLTPELKPYFGGTYWPPVSRMGMPGFRDVVIKAADAWQERRPIVENAADELTEMVVQMGVPPVRSGRPGAELLRQALSSLERAADPSHGGFGGAPKFPHPMDLRLLMRLSRRFNSSEALEIARLSLNKMSAGGIYDHLGGGFHRYSTDARWLVPHFEKMLYDNALLVSAYLEAFQLTGNEDYARVVRETLDYVLREMTHRAESGGSTAGEAGGFFSTQDADSEGVEGKFFVWSEEEITALLGPEDARIFNYCYDVTAPGNWDGHNILNRVKTHAQAARMLGLSENVLWEILARCRKKLFEQRSTRVPPGRDDKILASWNGLMISAMAQAACVLGERRYAQAATAAAEFILARMRTPEGRLLHVYKDGRARFPAYLDDYACLIDGLIDVWHATFDVRWIEAACTLADAMIAHFFDAEGGGFFFTADDHETLIARNKDVQDNATPSGNGMAACALLRLARLTGRSHYEEKAVGTLEAVSGLLAQAPLAGGQSLLAADFLLGPAYEIVVVPGTSAAHADQAVVEIYRRFLPNKVVLKRAPAQSGPRGSDAAIPSVLPALLEGKTSAAGDDVTTYICRNGACQAPVHGSAALPQALDAVLQSS